MPLTICFCTISSAVIVGAAALFILRRYRRYVQRLRNHYQSLFQETESTRGLFTAVFHAGGEGRVAIDSKGKVLAINRTTGEIFGFPENNFLSKEAANLCKQISAGCLGNTITQAGLENLSQNGEKRELYTKSGRIITVNASAIRNVMREQTGTLYIFQDMTESLRLQRIKEEVSEKILGRQKEALSSLSKAVESFQKYRKEAEAKQENLLQTLSSQFDKLNDLTGQLSQIPGIKSPEDITSGSDNKEPLFKTIKDKWHREEPEKVLKKE